MTHLLSRKGSLDSEPMRPARGVWLPDALVTARQKLFPVSAGH
jgi:hypothetical protein